MADTSPLAGGMIESDDVVSANSGDTTTSNDQWRVFLGIAMLIASYVFRVEVVRFTLRLAKRAVPGMLVWIKEFEKSVLLPLSWVVFVLLVWFSTYVMDLAALVRLDESTIASLIRLFLGFPLIWTVICLCNYVTWGIIRVKGWNRAATKNDDDYNRVMIISEGIGVIKILLVAYVVSSFMFDGIGKITNFDSSQLTTVAVLVVEFVWVFGSHTWLKNTMGGLIALIDEQIKSGSHVHFQGHEGIIEQLFLQCFCIRRYDKGLVYIPNGLLLEHSVEIKKQTVEQRSTIQVHMDHDTNAAATRRFIQELDGIMVKFCAERQQTRKSTVLGLDRKPRGGWDFSSSMDKAKVLINDDEDHVKPRFWISIAAPFVIHVVYITQEHHAKHIMAEKTELVLRITQLLAKQRLRLHAVARLTSTFMDEDDDLLTHPLAPPPPRTEPAQAPGNDRPSDLFQKYASEGNMLRQRRLNLAHVQ